MTDRDVVAVSISPFSVANWLLHMLKDNLILHHYTSGNGLLGIFESDSVWATKIHYLNDASEFRHAIDEARSYLYSISYKSDDDIHKALCRGLSESLERIEKLNVYVACFSGMEDSLSQWRGYCPSGFGYSIGFSAEGLRRAAQFQGFELLQCVYDHHEKRRLVEAWAQRALQELRNSLPMGADPSSHAEAGSYKFYDSFVKFAPVLKDHAFHNEYEWRLIGMISSGDPRIRLRSTKSMLAPYVPIKLDMKRNENLVWNLKVGPTPHVDLAISALGYYFGKVKIKNGIGHSSIPYRDW